MVVRAAPFALLVVAACAPSVAQPAPLAPTTLAAIDGAPFELRPADAKLTVVEFFSAHCPCQALHDVRLRELYARFHDRGVAFVSVDSEVDATAERDAGEARARAFPFPLVLDRGGALADRLGAAYATYTVVVDARGDVVYRGGIDSDKWRATETATTYLADALEDALAGRPPRVKEGKALGCALRRA
jgi:hypothetical protein